MDAYFAKGTWNALLKWAGLLTINLRLQEPALVTTNKLKADNRA